MQGGTDEAANPGSLAPTDIRALMRHVAHQLTAAGVDVALPEWPASSQLVLSLDRADPAENWRLVMIAQLQAFELLAQSLGALTEPSGVEVDVLGQRELRRWWEAGAFSFLRSSARLVERLTHEMEAAEAAILAQEPPRPRNVAYAALGLATAAHVRGDPEAALVHALRCGSICVGASTSPEITDKWAALRSRPDRVVLAELLERAEEIVDAYSRGDAAGPALPVASALLPLLDRLVTEPGDRTGW
jgi:hypothetical protein